MIKKLSIVMFGLALLIIGACSQGNGTATANTIPDSDYLKNLPPVAYLADSHGSYLTRFVDCEANVTVYMHSKGVTAIANTRQVSQEFVDKHCKGK